MKKSETRSSPGFSRTRLAKNTLFWFLSAVSGLLLTSGFAHIAPGPNVDADIIYMEALPNGKPMCPQYTVGVASKETLDYMHFEIQFPERVGEYRLTGVTFKDVGPFAKVARGRPIPPALTTNLACQFREGQETLPSSVGYAFYPEPASKIVVSAGDLSSPVFGIFTIPAASGRDPLAGIDAVVEYRYTKFGFSVRKKTTFRLSDARKFQFMGDKPY